MRPYQGYAPDSLKFTIQVKDSLPLQFSILLNPKSASLLQVVVRASIPPAILKNDTIAFNAGAYPSPPNSTVEDILKKLPGIEIDKDGNITMQGQKVDKITLDGKDFFLNDLRSASQTLPADLIAQVEVFDTQSEKTKLTGIKGQSNTRTINLKLKKKHPVGFFGKVYGGIGPDDSYSVGGNATRLDNSQMIFISGNANNINNQFTGTEHQSGPGTGEQTQNNLQLNYRDAWSKKLNATLNAGRTYDKSLVDQFLSRQTALTDSSILQNSESKAWIETTGHTLNADFEYAADSLTQINLHSNWVDRQTDNKTSDSVLIQTLTNPGSYVSSEGKTNNSLSSTQKDFRNSLDFKNQLSKKGRLIYLNLSQNSTSTNEPASLFSLVQNYNNSGYALNPATVNQQSTQTTSNNSYFMSATYTEPVGTGHILDFSYSYNHLKGHSDKKSFDYDSATMKYDIPDSLTTNRFLNYNTIQSFGAGYNTTNSKYQYQLGITGQINQLENLNQVNGQTLHQQTIDWFPRASLLWDMGKGKNLSFIYFGNSLSPTIDQLQPVPDLTNPYLIKIGNPNLAPQLTHILITRYDAFNSKKSENWQFVLHIEYGQNQITSSSNILPGGIQKLEYVNVNGVYHGYGFLTYGFPLGSQKNGNASVSLNGQYGHDISLINGVQNTALNTGVGGSANVNFHVKNHLFIDGRVNINQTFSNYSLAGSPSAQTMNENYSMNINYRLPAAVTLASYYNLQVTGSQTNLPAQIVSLWNASVYKSVLKDHCELRVSAYDLLNSSNSFSQSTGVNYVQTQRTNLPGRTLLFSMIYRFRKIEG